MKPWCVAFAYLEARKKTTVDRNNCDFRSFEVGEDLSSKKRKNKGIQRKNWLLTMTKRAWSFVVLLILSGADFVYFSPIQKQIRNL